MPSKLQGIGNLARTDATRRGLTKLHLPAVVLLVDVGLSPNFPAYSPAPVQIPTRLAMLLHALDVADDLSPPTWLSCLQTSDERPSAPSRPHSKNFNSMRPRRRRARAHAGFAPTTLAVRVYGDLNLRWSSHTGASAFTVCTCVHTDETTAMPSARRTQDR